VPGAAVELEDPLGGVVEEVAIVGDGDHGAGEAHQVLLEPFDAFRVEVVGRLVQQQHVGLGQQQAAERHAALLASGQDSTFASHGGRRSASAATSSWVSSVDESAEASSFSSFSCSAASLSKSASGSAYSA
jgi:hypothetical protein